jgi:protein involved in polysaccharide export with SLBB domain
MVRALMTGLVFATGIPCTLSAQTQPAASPSSSASSASLLPGDLIAVRIWREEDLSGEFQVDEDGFVVLPLLGRREVVGISPDILRDQLTSAYDEYLVNPSVNVTLLRRVTVLGEVRLPGNYPVDATVSIAQLIGQAQGLTPDGDINRIQLVRDGRTVRSNLSGTMALTDAGVRSGDQVFVGKRSWLSRNLNSVVGFLSIVSNIVTVIIITNN